MDDNLAEANTVLFNDKNYAFITDSTSNSGSFSSGQITFDLATLNSQSQWINLSEAVIEFPVKVSIQYTTDNAGTGGETNTIANLASIVMKNGWHQWIDSCQLIVNNQTIQASQPWENVAAQFRILSSWSQDNLRKWGPSCCVAVDDCSGDTLNLATAALQNVAGISNTTYTVAATAGKGYDAVSNQATMYNKGVAQRSVITNNDINPAAASLQTTVLGAAAMKTAGRSNVSYVDLGTTTVNDYIWSANYMATVRLRDICDINDFPLIKNLKGFLYLSFNSTQVSLTGTTSAAGAAAAVVASMNISPLTGHTTPFMINNSATGLVLGSYATTNTTAPVVTVVGSVNGATNTATEAIGSTGGPLLTNARLLVPYYLANPKADTALSQSNKFFTTLEKIINPITVPAGVTINYTITTGVANARRLIMLPMWQNLGQATPSTATVLTNPEYSPFDSVPGSSGPYCGLSNLQVYLANKPIYQYPVQYDYEQYVQEQAQLGLNGEMISEQTSGLLSQMLWEQNHRFYTVDLSRRMDSEDGSSKSVQVSFTNPSPTFGMKVIAIVQYERKWMCNTSQGLITAV